MKIEPSQFPLLIEALRLWTGHGTRNAPHREDALVRKRFGEEIGTKLLSTLKVLEREFYSSEAYKKGGYIGEIGRIAASEFRAKYPEIPEEIVNTLKWCYTFDRK